MNPLPQSYEFGITLTLLTICLQKPVRRSMDLANGKGEGKAMEIAHSDNSVNVIKVSHPTPDYCTQGFCWGWRLFVALIGFVGGIATALLGSIFTASTWITGDKGNGAFIHTLGTDFLLLTIPLLIVGAHCLDLEEKRKSRKPN